VKNPLRLVRFALVACLGLAPLALVGCAGDAGPDSQVQDDTAADGKFEVFKGTDGRYYFHLLAGNFEKVLQSQGYTRKASAVSGVSSVRSNGATASNYKILESADGHWYWNLVAKNGEVIGTSEMYATQSNAQRAADTVRGLLAEQLATQNAVTSDARFEVFKGQDGKYYFHVRAANGEIVLQSQGYTSEGSAFDGTDSVRANGAVGTRVTVLAAANGQYFFHVKASNGRIIGQSEVYFSESNAQRGRDAFVSLMTSNTVAAPAN